MIYSIFEVLDTNYAPSPSSPEHPSLFLYPTLH